MDYIKEVLFWAVVILLCGMWCIFVLEIL